MFIVVAWAPVPDALLVDGVKYLTSHTILFIYY